MRPSKLGYRPSATRTSAKLRFGCAYRDPRSARVRAPPGRRRRVPATAGLRGTDLQPDPVALVVHHGGSEVVRAQRAEIEAGRVENAVPPCRLVLFGSRAAPGRPTAPAVRVGVEIDHRRMRMRVLDPDHLDQAAQTSLGEVGLVTRRARTARSESADRAGARRRLRAAGGRCAPDDEPRRRLAPPRPSQTRRPAASREYHHGPDVLVLECASERGLGSRIVGAGGPGHLTWQ